MSINKFFFFFFFSFPVVNWPHRPWRAFRKEHSLSTTKINFISNV